MEQRFLRALRRILDATAFENVGHLRDFEELLQRGDARDKPAGPAPAAPPADAQSGETTTLFLASGKVDRDS